MQHERMRRRARIKRRAPIPKCLHIVHRRLAQRLKRWRPPAVVHVVIPLVAQDALVEHKRCVSRRHGRRSRVRPRAVLAEASAVDDEGVVSLSVDCEHVPAERVLRLHEQRVMVGGVWRAE